MNKSYFTFGISNFAHAPGSAFFILISCLVPRNETEDSLTVIIWKVNEYFSQIQIDSKGRSLV